MSDSHSAPETPELRALHARLAEYSLGGHWQTREKILIWCRISGHGR